MADELVPVANAGASSGGEGEKKSRPHLEIQRRVAATLASSGPQLLKAVETALVDVQQKKRTDAILKAVEKLTAADKELRKLEGGGVQSFNAAGEPVGTPTFSKAQSEDIKKKREEIQKLENALSAAIGEKLDFQKLFDLTGDKGGQQNPQ